MSKEEIKQLYADIATLKRQRDELPANPKNERERDRLQIKIDYAAQYGMYMQSFGSTAEMWENACKECQKTLAELQIPAADNGAAGRIMIGESFPGVLASLLNAIEVNDEKYIPRYAFVLHAVSVAISLKMKAGFRIDPKESDWPVAYIELPTGQVSWHLPQHKTAWDGHDTKEKYRRCREFIESATPPAQAAPETTP